MRVESAGGIDWPILDHNQAILRDEDSLNLSLVIEPAYYGGIAGGIGQDDENTTAGGDVEVGPVSLDRVRLVNPFDLDIRRRETCRGRGKSCCKRRIDISHHDAVWIAIHVLQYEGFQLFVRIKGAQASALTDLAPGSRSQYACHWYQQHSENHHTNEELALPLHRQVYSLGP